jgi:hypothetical protein
MNTSTESTEMRDLTPDEIESVSGGSDKVEATFKYGNFDMSIIADAKGYTYCYTGDGGKTWNCKVSA